MREKIEATHLTLDLEFATNTTHTEDARRPEELVTGQGGFCETLKSLGRKASPATTRGTQNAQNNGERITNPVLYGSPCSQTPSLLNVLSGSCSQTYSSFASLHRRH
jgi:hypothetical protein